MFFMLIVKFLPFDYAVAPVIIEIIVWKLVTITGMFDIFVSANIK